MRKKIPALLLTSFILTSSCLSQTPVQAEGVFTQSGIVAFANTVSAETETKHKLVGRWVADVPYSRGKRPLYMDTRVGTDGHVEAAFSYRNPLPINPADTEYQTIDLNNNKIKFLYGNRGIGFDGKFDGKDKIVGLADRNSRALPITFRRLNSLEIRKLAQDHKVEQARVQKPHKKVAILIFDGVDLLDWAGPNEVFAYAGIYDIYLVAAERREYEGFGYSVLPDYDYSNAPKPDILVVPGGYVTDELHNQETLDWIKSVSEESEITLSVCTGALFLAKNGQLEGKRATTHWSWESWFTAMGEEQGFTPAFGERFVDNDNLITTAGVSSGIDGTLHLVARQHGLAVAKRTARSMEYNWEPDKTQNYRP